MPKLRLKRTPEEEAAHQLRKRQRREKKRERRHKPESNHESSRPWASSDDELRHTSDRNPGRESSERPDTFDYASKHPDLDEQDFREKLFDAFADDERLDSVEAQFNDFAHVPGRWRPDGDKPGKAVYDGYGPEGDEFLKADPRSMDDEEYAEWIRLGIKTHAKEYAEQQMRKEMKAQRRAEEKARRLETRRLEKLAEEERQQRKLEKEKHKRQSARKEYELRWNALLLNPQDNQGQLSFNDIPWPTFMAYQHKRDLPVKSTTLSIEHLSTASIAEFLVSASSASMPTSSESVKERKDKLREAFLRFHPDKFEGRFMKRVKVNEREAVREAIGQVVRSLTSLMNETT
ncbi:hypothetical protein H0H93_007477 [Arthromyces matolae]|nr:hypothetical protein H0H93_007477 [Arthromyces matolae]